MGTARVPCHQAGLLAVPRWGPAGLARIARFRGDLRRPDPKRRRGHPARPGAARSSRGQPTRTGTGIPPPTASKVPARTEMSPPTKKCPRLRRYVPAHTETSPAARSAPARAVGLDHEYAPSHQPPSSPHLRRPVRSLPNQRRSASSTNKRPRISGAGPPE